MILSKHQEKLGIICGISGAVQSCFWMILALIAIILHYSPPQLDEPLTFGELLNAAIYYSFISKDQQIKWNDDVLRPQDFVVFMFFYLLLCAVWFCISVAQLIMLISIKKRQYMIITANGVLTLIISVIDIIFWGLLLREYVDCSLEPVLSSQSLCYVSTGVIMTVVIRGYTLWFINLFTSCLLIWNGVKNMISEKHWAQRNIGSIPRAKLQNDSSSRTHEPIYSDDPIFGGGRGRSSSPIFSNSHPRMQTQPVNGHPSHLPSYLNYSDKDARPQFLDRSRHPTQPTNPLEEPISQPSFLNRGYQRDPPAQPTNQLQEPNRQPSFLSRNYERNQGSSQPRSFRDQGGKFVY